PRPQVDVRPHESRSLLHVRHVRRWSGRRLEWAVERAAYDTNDLTRPLVGHEIESYVLANRILTRKELLRHRLTDDDDRRCIGSIARVEITSTPQWDAHRVEKPRGDRKVVRRLLLAWPGAGRGRRGQWPPFDQKGHGECLPDERWRAHRGNGPDTREALQSLEDAFDRLGPNRAPLEQPRPPVHPESFERLACRQAKVERQDVGRIRAQIVCQDA